ncbi:MAG: hypothetical protein KYX69_19710 [Sphingomonas sp.]|uniref:hypothetical protein n=1 Tax=Sphingomonas sp. TaxID=28214 RepID=UPI00262EECE8|nr:hypothetical protein [Sphingomonas sp.]MDK2769931.1 hypothetical protein [Sphingomonas sp.]
MANQTGIAISIKAFLPTGKSLDEQFAALTLVKTAHETGDYSALLKAANVEDVKTEQKTRRVEDAPPAATSAPEPEPAPAEEPGSAAEPTPEAQQGDGGEPASTASEPTDEPIADEKVPGFLRRTKPKAA